MSSDTLNRDIVEFLKQDIPGFEKMPIAERNRAVDGLRVELTGLTRAEASNRRIAQQNAKEIGAFRARMGASAAYATQSLSNLTGLEIDGLARGNQSGMSGFDYLSEGAGDQLREDYGDTGGAVLAGLADVGGAFLDPAFLGAGGVVGVAGRAVGATGAAARGGQAIARAAGGSTKAQQAAGRIAATAGVAGVADSALGAAIGYEQTGTLSGAAKEAAIQGVASTVMGGGFQAAGEGIGALRRTLSPSPREQTAQALRKARELDAPRRAADAERAEFLRQQRIAEDAEIQQQMVDDIATSVERGDIARARQQVKEFNEFAPTGRPGNSRASRLDLTQPGRPNMPTVAQPDPVNPYSSRQSDPPRQLSDAEIDAQAEVLASRARPPRERAAPGQGGTRGTAEPRYPDTSGMIAEQVQPIRDAQERRVLQARIDAGDESAPMSTGSARDPLTARARGEQRTTESLTGSTQATDVPRDPDFRKPIREQAAPPPVINAEADAETLAGRIQMIEGSREPGGVNHAVKNLARQADPRYPDTSGLIAEQVQPVRNAQEDAVLQERIKSGDESAPMSNRSEIPPSESLGTQANQPTEPPKRENKRPRQSDQELREQAEWEAYGARSEESAPRYSDTSGLIAEQVQPTRQADEARVLDQRTRSGDESAPLPTDVAGDLRTGRTLENQPPSQRDESSIMYFYGGIPLPQPVMEAMSAFQASVGRGFNAASAKAAAIYAGPMIRRIAGYAARSRTANRQLRKMEKAKQNARTLINGKWQKRMNKFKRTVNGSFFGTDQLTAKGRRKANLRKEMLELVPDAHGNFNRRWELAMENDNVFNSLSDDAKALVTEARSLVRMVSKEAEAAGLKMELKNGQKVDFVANADGKKLPRMAAGFLLDSLRKPNSDPFKQSIVTAIIKRNKLKDTPEVRKGVIAELETSYGERANIGYAPTEHARAFKEMPSVIVHEGQQYEILDTDPFRFADSLSWQFGHRIGFYRAFGQDMTAGRVDDLSAKVGVEMGDPSAGYVFRDTMKSISGMPIERPVFRSGTFLYNVAEVASSTTRFLASGERSRAWIVNAAETVAKVPAYAGFRRYLRAIPKLFKNTSDLHGELVRAGAYTDHVRKWTLNPNHYVNDLAGALGQTVEYFSHISNDFNEFFSAAVGMVMRDDLRAGRGTSLDRERLRLMQFRTNEINHLMRGTASNDLYDEVARRVPMLTQNANASPYQRSRLASSRVANEVVKHDSYMQMTFARTADVIRRTIQNPSYESFKVLTEYFAGSTVSGGFALFARAAFNAPVAITGISVAYYNLKDNPFGVLHDPMEAMRNTELLFDDRLGFVGDALMQTTVGGPGIVMMEGLTNSNEYTAAERMMNAVAPYRYFKEFQKAAAGWGEYRGMDNQARIHQMTERLIPLYRTLGETGAIAYFGTSQPSRVKAARSGFFGFLRSEGIDLPRIIGGDRKHDDRFYAGMKRAMESIERDADVAETVFIIREAIGVAPDADVKTVRDSLGAKMYITPRFGFTDDENGVELLRNLRKRIGEEAFQTIVERDQMIKAWLDAL